MHLFDKDTEPCTQGNLVGFCSVFFAVEKEGALILEEIGTFFFTSFAEINLSSR